jgi:hypothetical protein
MLAPADRSKTIFLKAVEIDSASELCPLRNLGTFSADHWFSNWACPRPPRLLRDTDPTSWNGADGLPLQGGLYPDCAAPESPRRLFVRQQ